MKNFKLFEKCNRRIARRVTLIAVLLAMCMPQVWADMYLIGSMNGWDADSWNSKWKFDGNGELKVHLDAGNYHFRIRDGYTDRYWQTSAITSSISKYTLGNEGTAGTCYMETTQSGLYIFKYVYEDSKHKLSISFPKDRVPKGTILYFSAWNSNTNRWRDAAFHAKYVYKYYDSGANLSSGAEQWCESPVTGDQWVFYTTVPNNDYVGKIQVCRIKPSDHSTQWGYTNDAVASSRTDERQNCMYIKSENADWTSTMVPGWSYYCPPTTSETFADNSTSKISWQDEGNDGSTSGKAILVKTGTTLKVTASASKAVADANMTVKYDFQVNSGSVTSQTSGSYTATASTNNTEYNVKMQAYTNYNLKTDENSAKSTTKNLYYKALDTYTVTNSLTNITSDGRSGSDAAAYNIAYTATLSASSGYNLPAAITVTRGAGATDITANCTWDHETGELTIPAAQVTGNITITASGVSCPTGGTVYSFVPKTTSGDVSLTGTPINITNNTDVIVSTTRGNIKAYSATSGYVKKNGTNGLQLTNNAGYLILELDCPLEEGDKVVWTSTNASFDLCITTTYSSSTDLECAKGTNQSAFITSDMEGKKILYIKRHTSSNVNIQNFKITRAHTITLDAQGGTCAASTVSGYEGDKVVLPHSFGTSLTGYRFLGWYDDPDDGTKQDDYYEVSSTTTLYAHYDDCLATGTIFSLALDGDRKPASRVYPPKQGTMDLLRYADIDGGAAWAGNTSSSSDYGGVSITPTIVMENNAYAKIELDCSLSNGDVITFAGITNSSYTWVSNSSTRPGSAPDTKVNNTNNTITCDGSNLTGKTLYIYYGASSAFTGITITRPAPVSTFDVTIASNNTDYGDVDVKSLNDVESGTEISASDNELTIGETVITATPETSDAQYTYAFTSWTKSDGTALPSTLTANLNILANFSRTTNTYTITWENYDGTTLETDASVAYGATPSYNGSTPTKASTAEYDYSFNTWDPTVTSVTEDATYTATFTETARNYTLAWDKNGEGDDLTGSYTSGTTAYGTELTAPNTPTWSGHRFDGWNTKANGSGDAYTGTMPAADTKYYAQWTVLHDVTITATNVTKSTGAATAAEGEDYVATFSTVTGYDLPTSVAVKIGDDDAVLTTDYTWSAGTLTVLAASVTDDITITVIGDPQTYTISYKDKGGSDYSGSNLASLPSSHTYGTATDFVNGVKANYTFDGWFTDSNCESSAGSSIGATAITSNTTYYASWTAKTAPTQYAVTIDAATVCSGSTTNIKMAESQSGVSYQLYNGEDKVGDAKAGGSALTWSSISATGTYKVMAVENETYASREMSNTVTLANYDAVDIATQPTASVSIGIDNTGSLSGLTLVSGTFNNAAYQWQTCTDAEGTGATDITSGSAYANYNTATLSFTPASEGTYYFRCVVSDDCGNSVNSDVVTVTASDMYVITYNANGGTGTMANTMGAGSVTLRANAFTRTGYKFMGWAESSIDANLGKIYYADAATITLDASMTLYAVWAKRIYYYKDATHYDGDAYTNPEGNAASSGDDQSLSSSWTIGSATGVTSVVAKNTKYDGKGSYMNAYIKIPKGGDKDSKNITFTLTSDYIATLKIKIGGYSSNPTVAVQPLISSALGDAITPTSGSVGGVATTEDNFTELTYSLNNPGGTYVLTVTGQNAYVSEITMLGTWCYATTLNKNNSDVGSEDGSAYIAPFGKKLLGLSAPTRTGYTVQGYYAESGCTTLVADAEGNLKANVTVSATAWTNAEGEWILGGGRTLYAKWGASRTLTYNANGASGSAPSAHDYVVGTTVTVSDENTLTKAGYTFIGWNSAADGSGIFYAEGTNFRMPAENLTLYAQWYGVELANIDFRASKWTGETFSQGNTDTYDVKYGLTFNSKDGSKSFSLANNTTDGLTFPANMSSSNYFFGIPLSDINGSITIIIKHAYSSSKASFKYVFKDGATAFSNSLSSVTTVQDASNSDTEIVFSVDATNANHKGYLYIGQYGTSFTKILGIQVVTPGVFSGKTVTFDNMTGFTGETTLPDQIDVPSGSKIVQPVNPKAAKWVFAGWYGDETCTEGNEIDWSMSITANKTIYAKWIDVTGKYTFHYGTGDPDDHSTWEIVPFTAREGSTSGYEVKDFYIPNTVSYPEYFVGYEGEFMASGLGTGDVKSKSVVSPWDTKMKVAYCANVTGIYQGQLLMSGAKKAEGAKGSIIMATYYSSDNLYVGFEPNAFGLDWRSSTTVLHKTPNPKIYETDVVTLAAADISDTYEVRLATSDSYVECGQSAEETIDDDIDGRKISGESYDIESGAEGRFQILINSNANNFGLRFVPLVNRTQGSYSMNWTADDNWTLGRRPTIDEDAYINTSVSVNVADATANKVIISKYGSHSTGYGTSDNDGRLYIEPTGGLLIADDLTVQTDEDVFVSNSEAYDLQIKSSAEGNGALIMGSADSETKALYQFYSKAKSDGFSGTWVNQFIGIPFNAVAKYEYYSTYLYSYVHTTEAEEWSAVMSTTKRELDAFAAYCILREEGTGGLVYPTGKLLFPGTSGTQELTYDREETGAITGNYMFANSWTAPISIDAMEVSDFVGFEPTIYLFNAGSSNDVEVYSGTPDGPGQWTTIVVNDADADDVIPSTQGFQVAIKAETSDPASLVHKITLDYGKHVYEPAADAKTINVSPTRAPRREGVRNADRPERMHIYVHGESGCSDNIKLLIRDDFTAGFDNGWDGRKMYGMDFAPQFYAMNDDGKMSVDALADVEGTILGFKAGTTDDVYTISFDCGEYTDMLYLYDMDMDIYTPVTNEDTYTFATTDKNEHQRFILTRNRMPEVTTGVDAIDVDGEKSVKATKFIHNEKIYILYRGVVYDMNGKRVIRK